MRLVPTLRTAFLSAAVAFAGMPGHASAGQLLNASYDPTRELWRALNAAFVQTPAGAGVEIKQSHGGSGTQARAVIDGLDADVVTLALWPDANAIAKSGLMPLDWDQSLPHNSVPYTSTIVFVVRKGNPKGIKDWPDLVKPDVQIITPNPKTSGNGKLAFLAAWGSVTERRGSEREALEFVTKLYAQVPVLDLGARGSTITFTRKKIGDVHLTWENEAYLEVEEARGQLEIVYPPISFLAEPPVAVVTANAKRKGTEGTARAYLEFVYTQAGQQILARNHYRPIDPQILAQANFPQLTLFPVTAIARSWDDATDKFFGDGKIFDTFYKPKK